MPRGGARVGAGRPSTSKKEEEKVPEGWELDLVLARDAYGVTPKEFMLGVMRDARLPRTVRSAMAVAVAPYCHEKLSDKALGKKEQRAEDSKTAGEGTEWADDLSPRATVN